MILAILVVLRFTVPAYGLIVAVPNKTVVSYLGGNVTFYCNVTYSPEDQPGRQFTISWNRGKAATSAPYWYYDGHFDYTRHNGAKERYSRIPGTPNIFIQNLVETDTYRDKIGEAIPLCCNTRWKGTVDVWKRDCTQFILMRDKFCHVGACQHGGICINGVGIYTCQCSDRFLGQICELQCPSSCAACHTNSTGGAVCTSCSSGYMSGGILWEGTLCLLCHAPCVTCKLKEDSGGVECATCPSGDLVVDGGCQRNDECLSKPCLNDGSCVDGIDEYSCVCTAGFLGENCQTAGTTLPGKQNIPRKNVDKKNDSTIIIAGAIVGSILLLLALAEFFVLFRRHRIRKANKEGMTDTSTLAEMSQARHKGISMQKLPSADRFTTTIGTKSISSNTQKITRGVSIDVGMGTHTKKDFSSTAEL